MDRRDNGSGSSVGSSIGSKRCARSSRGAMAAALSALAALIAPSVASAQDSSFYLDRLKIGGAPDDGIGVWRPHLGEQTRFFGQLGLGFGLRPFRVENYVDAVDQAPIVEEENGPPVPAQLITYISAGAEVAERFSVQVSFPLVLFQSGNPTFNESADITDKRIDVNAVAPMDLRLDGRIVVLRNEAKTMKLALQAGVWLPTGNELSFAGDNGVSGGFGLAAEYDAKKFFVTLNVGYQFRPFASLNEFTVTDELTYGVGAFVPLADGKFRVGAQVFGSLGIGKNAAGESVTGDVDNLPIEWMVEGRMALTEKKQVFVGAGAGTRITAGYAPDFRALAVIGGWFPLEDTDPKNDKGFRYKIPGDADGDKLADDIDMCPTDKEDGRGSNTDDGCPELMNDADSDGVPDSEDACPKEPGPRNADPTKNGCPEFIRRMKGSAQIEVLKEVQFAFDQANLLPEAFPILNEVVRLLKVNPDIELVSIEGHTDDVGTDQHNEELSQARARSVLNYIAKRGIAANRLESKGWGKRKPIAENQTAEGRQKNRRVEFHITKVKGAPPAQPGAPAAPGAPGAPGTPPAGAPGQPAGPATPPAGSPPAPGGAAPAPAGTTPAPAGSAAPKSGAAAPAPAGTTPSPAGSAAPKTGAPAPAPAGSAPAKGAAPAPTGAATPAKPAPSAAPASPVKRLLD